MQNKRKTNKANKTLQTHTFTSDAQMRLFIFNTYHDVECKRVYSCFSYTLPKICEQITQKNTQTHIQNVFRTDRHKLWLALHGNVFLLRLFTERTHCFVNTCNSHCFYFRYGKFDSLLKWINKHKDPKKRERKTTNWKDISPFYVDKLLDAFDMRNKNPIFLDHFNKRFAYTQ